MKKIVAGIILLVLFPCILSILPQLSAQQRNNPDRSRQIIERYNRLRIKKSIPEIQHEILLDEIAMKIQSNKKFRKSLNVYDENSIRDLLHKYGIIDYQYEIMEFPDKDMTSACTKFLLNDEFSNLRVGYSKFYKSNILIKTKSFLKFDHMESSTHTSLIDELHNTSATVDVITDSVKLYMKTLKKNTYSYYTTDIIPLKSDTQVISTKKPTVVKQKEKLFAHSSYDLVFTLSNDESNKYLVILNEKNERVAVLK